MLYNAVCLYTTVNVDILLKFQHHQKLPLLKISLHVTNSRQRNSSATVKSRVQQHGDQTQALVPSSCSSSTLLLA